MMGVFEAAFLALTSDADMENVMLDSTSCKVHQSSNGGKKTSEKAIGMSRCGLNTKIHAVVDGLGNPIAFLLSPGNDHDSVHALQLLDKTDIEGSNVIADKAYTAQYILDYIGTRGARFTNPYKSTTTQRWPVDWYTYKERHLIECFFQKLKWYRRIFSRYDKHDDSFLAFVHIAAFMTLLK